MKKTTFHIRLGLLFGSVLMQAHGANRIWDADGSNLIGIGIGGSGDWDNTKKNWDPSALLLGGSAWNNNDSAIFGGTAGTVTLGANINAGGLTFNTTEYEIKGNTGNTLKLTLTTSATITTNAALATISAVVANGGMIKAGNGTLLLSGPNTYTGATTVNDGIIKAGVDSIANTSGAFGKGSAITLANTAGVIMDITGFATEIGSLAGGGGAGGNVTLGSATLTTGRNDSITSYAGIISGTGGFTKIGTGTQTLGGNNTYTGVTTLTGGIIRVSSIGNGGSAGNLGQASSAAANLVFNGGTLQYTGATASTDRAFTINTNQTATFDVTTNNLTVSGASASTNGALTKTGGGTLTLSGANTYTGGTTVSAGTLSAAHANALGTGAVLINGGSVSSSVTSVSSGSITLNSGSLEVNAAAAGAYALGVDQDFTMTGGTLELTLNSVSSYDHIQGSGPGSIFSLSGGTLNLTVADYTTTYQIFSGFNSGSVSGLNIVNYDTTNYTANLADTGVLSFTAVPEPGPWALGGMGALLLLMRRRRSGAAEQA